MILLIIAATAVLPAKYKLGIAPSILGIAAFSEIPRYPPNIVIDLAGAPEETSSVQKPMISLNYIYFLVDICCKQTDSVCTYNSVHSVSYTVSHDNIRIRTNSVCSRDRVQHWHSDLDAGVF